MKRLIGLGLLLVITALPAHTQTVPPAPQTDDTPPRYPTTLNFPQYTGWVVAPFWCTQYDHSFVTYQLANDTRMPSKGGTSVIIPGGTQGSASINRVSALSGGLFVGYAWPRTVWGFDLHLNGMMDVLRHRLRRIDGKEIGYNGDYTTGNSTETDDQAWVFIRYYRPWSAVAHGGWRVANNKITLLLGLGITRCQTGLSLEQRWGFFQGRPRYSDYVAHNPYRPLVRATLQTHRFFCAVEYFGGISAQAGIVFLRRHKPISRRPRGIAHPPRSQELPWWMKTPN